MQAFFKQISGDGSDFWTLLSKISSAGQEVRLKNPGILFASVDSMKRNSGQGLIEYVILVALIAASAITVVRILGQNIREQYARISASLRGDKAAVEMTAPNETDYGRRGLEDFYEKSQGGTP